MYIYKASNTGMSEADMEQNFRIIEVEGDPTSVVGIRYRPVDTAADTTPNPAAGLGSTTDDRQETTSSQDDELDDQVYWADRPGGFWGGQRLRSTLHEDLKVRPLSGRCMCFEFSANVLLYGRPRFTRNGLLFSFGFTGKQAGR